jgi:AraC-like DNA-binding protein
VSAEHEHKKHQVLFCASGTMQVSSAGKTVLLPPQRAAWIPAGTPHTVASATGIALRTVYIARNKVPRGLPPQCTVFAVTPLAKEMFVFAMRWGPGGHARPTHDRARDAFFGALVALLPEWTAAAQPYFLPTAQSPEVQRALDWVRAHLVDATVQSAAKAAGMSVRTLCRHMDQELGATFRSYLQAARMMRAMELLSDAKMPVTRVAFEVGFQSVGAFTTAFCQRCGETPSAFRARLPS